jgi:two-component system response regulator (stage 0 sporulation protein A)
MIIMANVKVQILFADDNKEFTEVLCDYINLYYNNNIEVIGVANNGIEAIEMITEKKPDIVVLDIIMPYLDGIGVLEKINAMNMKRKPLFIMLSAVGENRIIQEALKLDAVYYINKPFDMDVLVSKIISLQPAILMNKDCTELMT